MIHKVLEEWFDTLLYVGIVIGLMGFFCLYWGNEYSFRHAKAVLHEFLDKASVSGKITEEEYVGLNNALHDIYPGASLEISCYRYSKQKIFDLIPQEKLERDFAGRNSKKKIELKDYEIQIPKIDVNSLCMQTETNASVLAADKKEYLPLPKDETQVIICAVRPIQEVYIGEGLITLCRITDSNGVYYKEAAYAEAQKSGEVFLELVLEDRIYPVPIEVICHPKTVLCSNGHCIVNTKEIIEEKKLTGKIKCTYCSMLPMQLICDESELHIKTGEMLTGNQIRILVTYLDGNTEYVSPDSKDWQDDFDSNYCGKQEITIHYRNMETNLMVVSENPICEKCGKECNDRSYEDYVKYPYCLECLSGMHFLTGEIREEELLLSKEDLFAELELKGEILLNRGDFFVMICKRGKNMSVMQRKIRIDGKSGKNK